VVKFPSAPQAPDEFFEHTIPALVEAWGGLRSVAGADFHLGVRLEGAGGGEWLYTFRAGALSVRAGSRLKASLTWIQSVADWRGALWEGRGGIVAEKTVGLLRGERPGRRSRRAAAGIGDAKILSRLAKLDGVLCARVVDGPDGDWSTAFKFGPGAIPSEATTTVSIRNDDAEALARRKMRPLEAFLAGRIRIDGSITFALQLQALAVSAGKAGSADDEGE